MEELTKQLRDEITDKSQKIAEDESFEAQTVLNNNTQILGLLLQVEALQRQSFVVMSRLGEDQGPTGKPRIGSLRPYRASRRGNMLRFFIDLSKVISK